MSCTPQGSTTPVLGLCKPNGGEQAWSTAINGNWDTIDAMLQNNIAAGTSITLSLANGILTISSSAGGTLVRGSLAGFTLSNDVNTPNTFLDIAAGQAADSTNANYISGAAFTKNTTTFVVGTGKGGLCPGLGALTPSTWFHVFAAVVSGSYDVFFDVNVAAANKPGGTTSFRRIGSFLTSSAASPNTAIMSFSQSGDLFEWYVPVLDLQTTNPGTSAILRGLSVPTGVAVNAWINNGITIGSPASTVSVYCSDPATVDIAPTGSGTPQSTLTAVPNQYNSYLTRIHTNTAGQIRTRFSFSDSATTYNIATVGWEDRRGRDT